jgi:hypothetical protein
MDASKMRFVRKKTVARVITHLCAGLPCITVHFSVAQGPEQACCIAFLHFIISSIHIESVDIAIK